MTQDAYIVDAVRTPVGRHGGALAGVRPDDLAAVPLRALLDRNPALDPVSVDEVYLGDANGAGEDNRNVARMATLLAGFPVTVPGATVNRLCGSGMEAVIDGVAGRRRRRCRGRRRRRRGEHDPRPVGGAQAGQGLPDRARAALEHDVGLADGEPAHARRVDHLAGRGRRGPGREVLAQP